MLSLDSRIELAARLGQYMLSGDEAWLAAQQRAIQANPWFTPGDISIAINSIAAQYLDPGNLRQWTARYPAPAHLVTVGIVMAGNIPLVGFHDLLCGFMSGHKLALKLSSKDRVLILHLIDKLIEWDLEVKEQITVSEVLKGCDAYIATGSNNTARYFEQYFGKYPHIIRKNRTSVAVIDGSETEDELRRLAQDVFTYYGLGCRNVSQLCVPQGYDFTTLLNVFEEHDNLMLHHKYKNNYDYYLAIYLLNKVPYLTNGSVLLIQNDIPFSAVSVLHYRFYGEKQELLSALTASEDIQCIVGKDAVPFGMAQKPSLSDYADGVDTMAFLSAL
ncbi:MAG: acyl-CoA reductase [Bacteroidetes bacterium]|nr:acyl-CoA reductase [Bacteroidota bacterium]